MDPCFEAKGRKRADRHGQTHTHLITFSVCDSIRRRPFISVLSGPLILHTQNSMSKGKVKRKGKKKEKDRKKTERREKEKGERKRSRILQVGV